MTAEWLQFGLALLVFIGGCFGVAARIGYVFSETASKIETSTDAKIGRVYERFDKYKDYMESGFVRKESCLLSHNSTSETLSELKVTVQKLNEKVDALLMRGA